jgi:hypothetical protein
VMNYSAVIVCSMVSLLVAGPATALASDLEPSYVKSAALSAGHPISTRIIRQVAHSCYGLGHPCYNNWNCCSLYCGDPPHPPRKIVDSVCLVAPHGNFAK